MDSLIVLVSVNLLILFLIDMFALHNFSIEVIISIMTASIIAYIYHKDRQK